ncbi:RluA family pseudouridine synthase [Alkalibacillus almallahensis]|uniref:RluA family pseudouridine synthase n=1 Tax=Alkalibacillus almallahensis TaxID=1379154 RepID=UPI001424A715|nr:RluA family pseudouridine synthase [Alkalibacillus almallahensis]NIK13221.1 23S rRNA pseudouridine1911/1915/1917 synthase [Alkalibacillus almallahensis]
MEFRWTIESTYDDWLVRDYLKHVRAFSGQLIKAMKQSGVIEVNGEMATIADRLNHKDVLKVVLPKEQRSEAFQPKQEPLSIVYEDKHVLVVNKERGNAVTPNMNDEAGVTLIEAVLGYFDRQGLDATGHVVTRLDRYTSGLVLVAKHRYSHHLMQQVSIDRWYEGVIEGSLSGSGTLKWPIARHLPSIIERKVSEDGQPAVTHYRVKLAEHDRTLVELKLETGRTHQIRVHMAHLGYPLIGDDLYGSESHDLVGQALHCKWLKFIHPISGQEITAYAKTPHELIELL